MARQLTRLAAGSALVIAASLLAASPVTADQQRGLVHRTPVAGSPGLGDPYFPLAGNGGYDVAHYSLDLDYDRGPNLLKGSVVIVARATRSLSSFDLDLRGFDIRSLTVNLRPASFRRDGQELIVSPRIPLRAGRPFVVRVEYAGQPTEVIDPDGSSEGWVPTADGAFVVNEPQGSPGWFPVNDNPRDKATYDIAITVPRGITAISNGRLLWRRDHGAKTTWHWREDSPMASYLVTATNGVFELRVSHVRGIPLYHAVDPVEASNGAFEQLSAEAEVIGFFSGIVGRYPFSSGGGIVDHAPEVGYALESQTKSQYDQTPDPSTVVHEIAHQWFGDSVTLAVWPDIWLNEGFATWSEWIYAERHGGATAQQSFDDLYEIPADDPFWSRPPADVGGPEFLFTDPPYSRGAMTLQALRAKLGDRTFFSILRAWYAQNRNGNVTTADFVSLAERKSGRQLDAFFDTWLYRPEKPLTW